MIAPLFLIAAKNLRRNVLRSVLTIAGAAVALIAFIMLRTVLSAWSVGANYASQDRLGTRHKISFVMSLPKKYIDDIRTMQGIQDATWANWFGARDPKKPDEFFANIAVDGASFLRVMDELVLTDEARTRWLSDKKGAVVGDVIAKKMGWKVGDRVILEGTIYPGDWEFTVDGIYTASRKSLDRSQLIFHWDYLNDALTEDRRDQIGWVMSRIGDSGRSADISAAIDRIFDDRDTQTVTMSERNMQVSFLAMFSAILSVLDVVSIIILLIMLMILGNTIAMGVRERTKEYAVLRAIGFEPWHVRFFVISEAATLGVVAGVVGVGLGYPFVNNFHRRKHGRVVSVLQGGAKYGDCGICHRDRSGGDGLAPPESAGRTNLGNRRTAAGRLMIPIQYNVRNLVVRKRTTLAAAFGLALVVFVFACAQMLGNGIRKALGRTASPDVAIVLRKGSDAELSSGIEESQVNLVLAHAIQVGASKKPAGVGEVVVVVLLEKLGTTGVSNVTVRGVPEGVLAFRPSVKVIEGRAPAPGADEVLIGASLRGRFRGLDLGQSFELKKHRPVKVVWLFADEGSSFESEVWADVDTVRQSFGRQGYVSSIRVRLDSPSRFGAFKALVEQNRQLGLVATREADYYEKQSEMSAQLLTVLGTLIAVFFSIGAMIGATITMNAQVSGRQREIGTLRALGFTRSNILVSFLLESIMLALAGGVVGAAASLAMKAVHITMLNANTWSEIVFAFEPTPDIVVRSVALAAFMGIVGGFLPALRAARVSPIEAMRT